MTTYALRIEPSGEVLRYDEPCGDDLARYEFGDQIDVVTLRAPIIPEGHLLVGFIHDWGRTLGHALNRKAWALYGGSPIYGTMFVQSDEREPLDAEFCDFVVSDAILPEAMIVHMDAWLAGQQMREQGEWPL
jgi:hypothetical protein